MGKLFILYVLGKRLLWARGCSVHLRPSRDPSCGPHGAFSLTCGWIARAHMTTAGPLLAWASVGAAQIQSNVCLVTVSYYESYILICFHWLKIYDQINLPAPNLVTVKVSAKSFKRRQSVEVATFVAVGGSLAAGPSAICEPRTQVHRQRLTSWASFPVSPRKRTELRPHLPESARSSIHPPEPVLATPTVALPTLPPTISFCF